MSIELTQILKIMKFATRKINDNSSYKETMNFFSNNFFGNDFDGEHFFYELGDYLDNSKFPTDKIILYPWHSGNKFEITFKYNNKQIAWHLFKMYNDTKVIEIYNSSYEDSVIKNMFGCIIQDFVNLYNNQIFDNILKVNNINNITDIINVVVNDYTHYKPNGNNLTLNGTFKDIIEQYTTHNDRLKYCNGRFWKFENKNFSKLHSIFIQTYNGNYFLDNAVKRGVTID